ncbi:RH39 [Symbiodinium natans]|uniref:RH39 protein n=1 Tax=Symbiodinium natans TaxID=878477 RepID=A0A812LKT5_9DINO|nr:RH39 [Symbiodinium natans]
MEEVEEWKKRPSEAALQRKAIRLERRAGRTHFDEKRGIGKVCDWFPKRGFGYLLCGSPPQKLIFMAKDVPQEYLNANDGKVPMETDVEFSLVGTFRGRRLAKNLVFPSAETFAELGLKPEVVEGAANSLGLDPRENPEAPQLLAPAPVQQEAIPYILNGDNIVIAAETGSGKSLAYMLPMVQIVQGMAQARNMDYGLAYRAGCPLALAICPTRELAIQAYKTLKLISHHARCRVRLVHGGSMTWRRQRQEISQVVDILVCTPDRETPKLPTSTYPYVSFLKVTPHLASPCHAPARMAFAQAEGSRDECGLGKWCGIVLTPGRIPTALRTALAPRVALVPWRDESESLQSEACRECQGFLRVSQPSSKLGPSEGRFEISWDLESAWRWTVQVLLPPGPLKSGCETCDCVTPRPAVSFLGFPDVSGDVEVMREGPSQPKPIPATTTAAGPLGPLSEAALPCPSSQPRWSGKEREKPCRSPASREVQERQEQQAEGELQRLRKELETLRTTATASVETLATARKDFLEERQQWQAERAELQRCLQEAQQKCDSIPGPQREPQGPVQLDMLSAGQWLAQLLPEAKASRAGQKAPEVLLDLAGAWSPLARALPRRSRSCAQSLHFGVFFGDDRQTPVRLSSALLCPEVLSWAPSGTEAFSAGSVDRRAFQADLCRAHERFMAGVFAPWAKAQEESGHQRVAWLLCNEGEAFTLSQAMLDFGKAAGLDERWRSTVLVVDRAKSCESEPAVEALALADGARRMVFDMDIRLEEVAYVAIDEARKRLDTSSGQVLIDFDSRKPSCDLSQHLKQADFLLTQGFDDLYTVLEKVDQDSRHSRSRGS